MDKSAAEMWFDLASSAFEEAVKEAGPLGAGLGAYEGAAHLGLGSALGGGALGGLAGVMGVPDREKGETRWDLIKKRLGKGLLYGGAAGAGVGAGAGGYAGHTMEEGANKLLSGLRNKIQITPGNV